ncbi:MAG: hypothetical protein R3B47_14165 [Bacteroidia bacterium]
MLELVNGMVFRCTTPSARSAGAGTPVSLPVSADEKPSLEQTQTVGSSFINELTNILITQPVLVIKGDLTLGMMLAISPYIIGQLNAPILQLVTFLHSVQDAKISLKRLSEVHNREDEEMVSEDKITDIPEDEDIVIDDLYFRLHRCQGPCAQSGDSCQQHDRHRGPAAEANHLMKMLLNFTSQTKGKSAWALPICAIFRSAHGAITAVVMQEGFIF